MLAPLLVAGCVTPEMLLEAETLRVSASESSEENQPADSDALNQAEQREKAEALDRASGPADVEKAEDALAGSMELEGLRGEVASRAEERDEPAVGVDVGGRPDTKRTEPVEAGKDGEGKPRGRVIAEVGDEAITLAELTGVVKERLKGLPPGSKPGRRQIIALSRSYLEARILRSGVLQAARESLKEEPGGVEEALARASDRWEKEELPRLLRRENQATESGLRVRLARRGQSLDDLKATFEGREVARQMMVREGFKGDLDAYLGTLKDRVPIRSVLDPKRLEAMARQAGTTELAR